MWSTVSNYRRSNINNMIYIYINIFIYIYIYKITYSY